jgi:RNA polymerase sigma-70 factor (ECF subfamily)
MQTTATAPTLSDHTLVRKALDGDKHAFGELVQRHRQKCLDRAISILRNRGDAEDEVQNALSKAYAHLDQYQGEAEFPTWLARIVTNQCLMSMRVKRRARFVYLDEVTSEYDAVPTELPACGPDPEGELSFNQMLEILKREIRHIPPMLRNVVLLRHVQNLPMSDVADQLGISVPAAKSRLVRARNELHLRLKRHCETTRTPLPLSRCAAPLNRVTRHLSIRPLASA